MAESCAENQRTTSQTRSIVCLEVAAIATWSEMTSTSRFHCTSKNFCYFLNSAINKMVKDTTQLIEIKEESINQNCCVYLISISNCLNQFLKSLRLRVEFPFSNWELNLLHIFINDIMLDEKDVTLANMSVATFDSGWSSEEAGSQGRVPGVNDFHAIADRSSQQFM